MTDCALPPVSLRQLQYVVAVATLRNFRRAAEACHVAQPSLSAQIALVEDVLGIQLFDRDRRGARVTAAGEAFIEQARKVLFAARDLTNVAQQFRDPFQGTLRLGVIPTIGPYMLPAIVPVLAHAFPGLTLQWTEDRTRSLMSSIQDSQLDAAIVALEADIGDCEYVQLGRDSFVLAGAPDHPLMKSHRPATLHELDGASVLLLDEGHCLSQQVTALCKGEGIEKMNFRATSLSTLVQMVSAGTAVTLLPSLALGVENRGHQLRIRRFVSPGPGRTLVLAWRRGLPLRTALTRLADVIRDTSGHAPIEEGYRHQLRKVSSL